MLLKRFKNYTRPFFALIALNMLIFGVTWTSVHAAQPQTIVGGFSFGVYDDTLTGESVTEYLLTTADGHVYRLDISPDVLGAAGGSLALSHQTVEVAGISLRDRMQLSVTSIQPVQTGTRFDPNPGASGSWRIMLCKFSDVSTEPYTTTQINNYYQSAAHGAFAAIGRIYHGLYTPSIVQTHNWVTLPNTQAHYRAYSDANGFDVAWLINQDCLAANGLSSGGNYNTQVFVNANWLDGIAIGGWIWDGSGMIRRTSIYPNSVNVATIVHEMGHANSLPHSSNANNNTYPYDNPWDVMSDIHRFVEFDATLGSLAKPHNSLHLYKTGFIPADDVGIILSGQRQTFTVDHWGTNTTANRFMVTVPIDNTNPDLANYVYAVETRFGVGNNGNNQENLPAADGVLIYKHEPESVNRREPVRLLTAVTDDSNSPNYGIEAALTTGMTYINETDDVVIEILDRTASGYNVRVQRAFSEASPRITISDAGNVAEGGLMTFNVTLSATHPSAITVNYGIGGSATSGTDYTTPSGSFVIPANTSSTSFSIQTSVDGLNEASETVGVYVTSMSAGDYRKGAAFGRITNAALPELNVDNATVTEGGTMQFRIWLSQAAASDVLVNYSTSNNSAIAGQDYTAASNSITLTVGQTEVFVPVQTLQDDLDEDSENFSFSISTASAVVDLNDSNATGTILDDDAAPTLSISGLTTVTEGQMLSLTLNLSSPATSNIYVGWDTTSGTATKSTLSTLEACGTVSYSGDYCHSFFAETWINNGQSSATLQIHTRDDSLTESPETFTLTLDESSSDDYVIGGTHPITITILDNDGPTPPTVNLSGANSGTEGNTLTYTVTLSPAPTSPVTVHFAPTNITAIAGTDYAVTTNSPLTFNSGQTSKNITVTTVNDGVVEGDESFSLALTGVTGGVLGLNTSVTTTLIDTGASTELAVNGHFDGGSILPWKVTNKAGTAKNDKIKCDKPEKTISHSAPCAFGFVGGASENTKLIQIIDLTGLVFESTDVLTFSLALKSNKPPQLTAKVLIKRASVVGTAKINLPLAATGASYQTFTSLPHTLGGADITSIKIQFIFKGTASGIKPFIDNVSLRWQ